jgi:site-specific DNA-methyltransferase (adenine-specific)
MKPYYQEAGIVIYHGDCREILPALPKVDLVLTDPPYSEKTHAGARSGDIHDQSKPIDFESVSAGFLIDVFGLCNVNGWVVSFIDWRHAADLERNPPSGLQFVRLGVWVKENPMPQLTGDRPATGWEAIALLRSSGVKKWNGGGSPATWICGTSRFGYFGSSYHPTQKPITLVERLIPLFCDAGQMILDPFMGSGTTIVAAKKLGRRAIGIEIEERYCEIAANRLRQGVLWGAQ